MLSVRQVLTIFAVTAATSFAIPATSFAQDDAEEGALPSFDDLDESQQRDIGSLIELGESSVEKGEHEKAISYYEDAFKIFPHPRLNHTLGTLYDKTGNLEKSIENYERFVELMPEAPEALDTKRRLLELKEKLNANKRKEIPPNTSLRVLSNPPGAQVFINDPNSRVSGTTPTVDLPVRPGEYTIYLKMDGYLTKTGKVNVGPGEQAVGNFTLAPDPRAARGGDPSRTGPRRKSGSAAPWVLLGIGVAGAATAATFGVLWNRAEQNPQGFTQEQSNTYLTMVYAGAGAAVLGFTGAAIFWIAGSGTAELDAPRTRPRVIGVGPMWVPGGRGAGFTVQF